MIHTLRAAIAVAVVFACLPAQAGQRAFVISTGNDANVAMGCTLGAPCRGFQAAHTAVDPGGEIVALDTAGYGAVVISKSVTIMANPGVIAGIAVSSGDGVAIATAAVKVVLKNLAINGIGGTNGIHMTDGASLTIEDCTVSNLSFGLKVENAAVVRVVRGNFRSNNTGAQFSGGATAEVVGSNFLGNGSGFGLTVQALSVGKTTAAVSDSVASNNFSGFVASANATPGAEAHMILIRATAADNVQLGFLNDAASGGTSYMSVASSMATGNGTAGFQNSGAGIIEFASLGNNQLYLNGTPTVGVIGALTAY